MRAITKKLAPPSLTAHRKTPHCNYDNYTDKDALRDSLVNEQRGLCCYCMGRVQSIASEMKIEHWRCQTRYPEEQLNYRNLLAACLGGQGQPEGKQHCDTCKGDRDLLWNPADPDHHIETRIRYEPDGTIRSDDEGFDKQLKYVLNLNVLTLRNKREAVLTGILDWWKREKAHLQGPVPRKRFQHKVNRLTTEGNDQPYSQVAVWWLRQRLARMR